MSFNIIIRKITTIPPQAAFIQWTLENFTETGSVTYHVERAESPSGPFEHIETHDLIDAYHYVDKDHSIFRKRYQVYYRIHAVSPSGENVWSDAKPLEITPKHRHRGMVTFGIRRTIQKHYEIALRAVNGTDCAILKKRHMGTRCPDCYDPVTRLPLLSHCETCKGTGFVGGFHVPFYTRVRVGADHIATQVANDGKTELNTVPFKMLDYPLLDEDDVIVQLNLGRYFRVKTVEAPTLMTQQIFQQGALLEIASGDIEYSIKELLGGNEATCLR